ncbi:MAG TPA: aldo/keto reductase [Vicinamibacteria bacterium]|nr:aldo/keto reductase [Vicinamibacteria bacterium]
MAKKETVSRREFLERSGLAVGAVAAMPALPPRVGPDAAVGTKLPHRTLGRTGASVSILAMGCGSRFLMYPAEQATAVLEKAVGLGIDYLDTAFGYGDGESETRLGRFLATRRKDVFLATKVPPRSRTRDAALREVEASLKRLQTDHLDLLHLHSLGDEADLAKIEAPDGAIKALYELREQKVTRFIGMTSHTDGAVMAKAIERNDLDCVQMAMNPARAARFEELALPAANRKNLGVILMKVTGQDKLLADGGADAASLLRYAWSLPISAAVCGMPKLEFLEANVAAARAHSSPLPPAEMDRLRKQLAGRQIVLERFFAHHHDEGWPA